MIHSLLVAFLLSHPGAVQIKAPQMPLNPYSIAEDYQRLYNLRLINGRQDSSGVREVDDCDRYEVRLWAALGIPLETRPGIGGDRSFCVAELQPVDWGGDAGQDVLLMLGGRVFQQYRYVLFVNTPAGMRYTGYMDGFSKYSDPAPRVVHFGNQTFLQTVTTTVGSGMNKTDMVWSDPTPQGGRAVLTSPDDGAEMSPELIREWSGSVMEIDPAAGEIRIDLSVSYLAPAESPDGVDTALFTVTDQAVYQWSPAGSRFDLDTTRSTLSAEELKQVFGNDVPLSGFLEWYLPELTRIAVEGNAQQKRWLRTWLERQPESSRKQVLLKNL